MPRIEVYKKEYINDFQVGEKVKQQGTIFWSGTIVEIIENIALIKLDKPYKTEYMKWFYFETSLDKLEYMGNEFNG